MIGKQYRLAFFASWLPITCPPRLLLNLSTTVCQLEQECANQNTEQ